MRVKPGQTDKLKQITAEATRTHRTPPEAAALRQMRPDEAATPANVDEEASARPGERADRHGTMQRGGRMPYHALIGIPECPR